MSWSREDFLAICETKIAKQLFEGKEIAGYVNGWSEDNKAALLHANGVTADSSLNEKKQLLQLVLAFSNKDFEQLALLVNEQEVSVGARLDYLLPLYDEKNGGGEDVFVASTKVILGADEQHDVHLHLNDMVHKDGDMAGKPYVQDELRELEGYVNNSFAIMKLFKNAPNKQVVQPTKEAVDYMIQSAATYTDTNGNPTIVFIPGAVSIDGHPVPGMIESAIKNGANIDDVGFFGVPGIVWSIILGDVEGVAKFLDLGAKSDTQDEMGNDSVIAWAASTYQAVSDNTEYRQRLVTVIKQLQLSQKDTTVSSSGLFSATNASNNASDVCSTKVINERRSHI